MHRLTDIIVATKRERKIAYTTADMRSGKILLYPTGCLDKIDRIIIVFFHPRSHGKHVRVKDDIIRIKVRFLCQQTISTLANFYLTFESIGLSFFIKSHHHSRRAILFYLTGMS